MNHQLTEKEKEKILDMVLNNPDKSCAITQYFVDCLQLVTPPKYAEIKQKSKRTVYYNSSKLKGIEIADKKFIILNQ
jgi:hypothetical protein